MKLYNTNNNTKTRSNCQHRVKGGKRAINMFTLVFMILFHGRSRSFVSAGVFVVLWSTLLQAFDESSSQIGHHGPLASVWTVAQAQ